MISRDEAIKIIADYEINGCGYCHQGGEEVEEAFAMAIEALKAQEPVEPTEPDEDNTRYCGACGSPVGYEVLEPPGIEYVRYNYCPECGKAVKW